MIVEGTDICAENRIMTPATNPQRPRKVIEDRRVHTCGDRVGVAR